MDDTTLLDNNRYNWGEQHHYYLLMWNACVHQTIAIIILQKRLTKLMSKKFINFQLGTIVDQLKVLKQAGVSLQPSCLPTLSF